MRTIIQFLTFSCEKCNHKNSLDNMSWWHHQLETFSTQLAIFAGSSPVTGEFPTQRPVTRSFDVFFDLHLNKRLSKQLWGWWFETPLRSLRRHCNVLKNMVQGLLCLFFCGFNVTYVDSINRFSISVGFSLALGNLHFTFCQCSDIIRYQWSWPDMLLLSIVMIADPKDMILPQHKWYKP